MILSRCNWVSVDRCLRTASIWLDGNPVMSIAVKLLDFKRCLSIGGVACLWWWIKGCHAHCFEWAWRTVHCSLALAGKCPFEIIHFIRTLYTIHLLATPINWSCPLKTVGMPPRRQNQLPTMKTRLARMEAIRAHPIYACPYVPFCERFVWEQKSSNILNQVPKIYCD